MQKSRQRTVSERSFDQYRANVPMWFADPRFDMSVLEKAWKGSSNMPLLTGMVKTTHNFL